jgi:hypothetical protein
MAICCVSLILPRVKARGRLVAAYSQVRLTPPVVGSYRQDFGALHLALFEPPGKDDFFSSLLGRHGASSNFHHRHRWLG